MEQIKFSIVYHRARLQLGLSISEYVVADSIYHLSNNPNSKVKGWCYSSKEYLAQQVSITRKQIHLIINKLIEKGLVEKDEETKHLRTTELWYKATVSDSEERLQGVTKGYTSSNKRLHQGSNKRLHNNNNIDNNKDNISSKEDTLKAIEPTKEYGNPGVNQICQIFEDAFDHLPNRKEQRKYATILINKHSLDKALRGAEFAIRIGDDRYAPKVTNPKQLWDKWADLVSYGRKNSSKVNSKVVNVSELLRQEADVT